MGLLKKKEKKDYTFSQFPLLRAIKPKERYVFHSDYYQVDSYYVCILSFFHIEGATDNFGPFWGINRIPSNLGNDISITSYEQIRRMGEGWIDEHQTKSEGISQMNANEQGNAGTNTSRAKAGRRMMDLEEIARELQDGAAYLHVHYRLQVKAPTLEKLDAAIQAIERSYTDRFGTLQAAPYQGDQKRELSTLFSANSKKKGRGFYFTSTEMAGSYSLVTHGLEDPDGEFVGFMTGDVNNSAVLFSVDGYDHHVVVANEGYQNYNGIRVHQADEWGSKISQSCLLGDHKVVHLILDGTDMDLLGPKFDTLTYRINMNHGDINMFEMFGDVEDELAIFSAQMQKLILMAEQAYETTDSDRSIIRASLEKIATEFYIDNRMWYENAKVVRDKLRVVGIPHDQVPKLEVFSAYLHTHYQALANTAVRDDEKLHALSVLDATFANLLSVNGDLFNTITTDVIDGAKGGRRVLYDFSKLLKRGIGVAMAQFVNVLGFAVGNLSEGDSVIIHGTDLLADSIKPYVQQQFQWLYDKGGRVVFLYNHIDKMLQDKEFSQFDKADYTILGNMTETAVSDYQNLLGQEIPPDLISRVTDRSNVISYIRRDFDNVVFTTDLRLGLGRNVKR